MKKEDNWVERYRDRLKDYSEPVPADIWDSLEKNLKEVSPGMRFPYRKLIVAAAILSAMIFSLSLYFLQTPQAESVRVASSSLPISESSGELKPVPVPQKDELVATVTSRASRQREADKLQPEVVLNERKEQLNDRNSEITEDIPQRSEAGQIDKKNDFTRENSRAVNNKYPMMHRKKGEQKWSMGVVVGNTSSTAGQAPGFRDKSAAMRDTDPMTITELMTGEETDRDELAAKEAFRQILMNTLSGEARTKTKHKMPFTVGLSFRYPISRAFSIETGLNYTLLSSEIKAGNQTDYYQKDQRLHYIGIPLKANWLFLNRKFVSLYLTVGGAVEKSVSGSLKTEYVIAGKETVHTNQKLNVKPFQWSVLSAIGVQYNATNHVGIFLEPGIVYYFDDGSPVETIRKEKPFNFNLQMGLRYTY